MYSKIWNSRIWYNYWSRWYTQEIGKGIGQNPEEPMSNSGAPWLSKSTHPGKFGNHVTVHRPPTADRPSAPQAYQCLLSHFLASLGAQEKTNCTSTLWSIDSYQNRASADQYHLTVPRAQVSTHRGRVFFESYPLTNYKFQMIGGSSLFSPRIHIKYVVFLSLWSRTIRILISNWPRKRKFRQFF